MQKSIQHDPRELAMIALSLLEMIDCPTKLGMCFMSNLPRIQGWWNYSVPTLCTSQVQKSVT